MSQQSRSASITVLGMVAILLAGTALAQAPHPGDAPRMKAIVYRDFGSPDVLRLEDVARPVPDDDQVLVKVHAASLNPLDWHNMEGRPYLARLLAFGLVKPSATQLGADYAGTVEAVGKHVTTLKPGDEVFGARTGALAEYVTARADRAVVRKPDNITFEQAAAVPIAAITALQGLRDRGKLQPGQKVLINGASGGVGTFAVQIAKALGADVTGVCSTKNVEMVRSLGASQVIDYTKDDFTKSGQRYDVVLDNVGNRSLSEYRRVLKPGGKYVLIGGGGVNDGPWLGPFVRLIKAKLVAPFVSQEMGLMVAQLNNADLATLADLMRSGKVTPVIDRRYPLSQTAEAMRYLEQGHARGKVIVTLDGSGDIPAAPAPAKTASTTNPGLVAFVLIGVLVLVTIVPIVVALVLDRRFRARHFAMRPYRWGYYFSIMSIIGGLVIGLLLESGTTAVIACGIVYAVLAWFFARRRRWAWIVLTILSLNPIAWIINAIYLRKRWGEQG